MAPIGEVLMRWLALLAVVAVAASCSGPKRDSATFRPVSREARLAPIPPAPGYKYQYMAFCFETHSAISDWLDSEEKALEAGYKHEENRYHRWDVIFRETPVTP